jgi:hypothetical protein
MGATEHFARATRGAVESLKSQPIALALIITNLMWLIGGSYTYYRHATLTAASLERLITTCIDKK